MQDLKPDSAVISQWIDVATVGSLSASSSQKCDLLCLMLNAQYSVLSVTSLNAGDLCTDLQGVYLYSGEEQMACKQISLKFSGKLHKSHNTDPRFDFQLQPGLVAL